MKILLCHNFYRYRGGEDEFVENLAALLESHGHKVQWLAAHSRDLDRAGWPERLRGGIGALYSPRTVRQVAEYVRAFQPDIAHVHNVFPQLSPSLYVALAQHGVPVVQHVHNFRFICPNGLFYTHGALCQRCAEGNFLHAVRLRCLHGSLSHSLAYAGSLTFHWSLGTFPGKLGTLIAANPFTASQLRQRMDTDTPIYELGHFIDVPARLDRGSTGQAVVYLGRLSEEKGVWTLLDAASQLDDLPFHLIGGGPLEQALREAVRERGLANVHIHGFIAGQARFDFLKDALCVVVPSLVWEQFGMAVVEAYAYELPVVATSMGALASLVQVEETGLLFPAGDAGALANSIQHLASNPAQALAMGKNGRRIVETTYSPEAYYTRLMQIYQDVVTSAGG